MANLASAKKRIRQNDRERQRNRARRSQLKTVTRSFQDVLHDGSLEKATETFRRVTKKLDQTAAKGTLHPNTAARRKSRLAKRINALRAGQKNLMPKGGT